MSFADLLNKLQAVEDELTVNELDFAILIGDVRDKVDSIRYVRERIQHEATWIASQIDELRKRKMMAERNKKALEDYVNWCLTQAELEECPGDKYGVKLQKNPVSVKVDREPTVDDFAEHEEFVRRKVVYFWDLSALKKGAEEEVLPTELARAVQLERGTHIRFYERKPV